MNCPSRTDDTLPHCDWNQNPPFLAPDLTTRQDLNGISNVRELKDAGTGVITMQHCLHDADLPSLHKREPVVLRQMHPRASLTQSGRFRKDSVVYRQCINTRQDARKIELSMLDLLLIK